MSNQIIALREAIAQSKHENRVKYFLEQPSPYQIDNFIFSLNCLFGYNNPIRFYAISILKEKQSDEISKKLISTYYPMGFDSHSIEIIEGLKNVWSRMSID